LLDFNTKIQTLRFDTSKESQKASRVSFNNTESLSNSVLCFIAARNDIMTTSRDMICRAFRLYSRDKNAVEKIYQMDDTNDALHM